MQYAHGIIIDSTRGLRYPHDATCITFRAKAAGPILDGEISGLLTGDENVLMQHDILT